MKQAHIDEDKSEEMATLTIHLPMRVAREIGKFVPSASYTCITDFIEKKICLLFPVEEEIKCQER